MRAGSIIFITIIPPGSEIPAGDLHALSPKRLGDRLRQQMTRVGLDAPIVGGTDGEYDEQKRVWRPHFHLIAPASSRRLFHDLKERFYSNPNGAYRPLHIRAVDNPPVTASYCVKSFWPSRRSQTDRNGNSRTKDHRLSGDLQSDWLVWRSEFQLENFIFLCGVRRHGDKLSPIAVSDKIAKKHPKGLVEPSKGGVALKDSLRQRQHSKLRMRAFYSGEFESSTFKTQAERGLRQKPGVWRQRRRVGA